MLELDSLPSPGRSTVVVSLGGRLVEARALSAAEIDAIRRVFPQPRPKMVPNPIIGGEPAFVPDTFSAESLAWEHQWTDRVQTSAVAIAVNVAPPRGATPPLIPPYTVGMSDAHLDAYLRAVVPLMRERLTLVELNAAYRAVQDASDPYTTPDGGDRIAAARKNLLGLPGEAVRTLLEELSQTPTA